MPECTPHPANVPGDFYVEDGCCLMCEVPLSEAPELFGVHRDEEGSGHCYVKRQPETRVHLDEMVSAIHCSETGCIRYRGTDRLVQHRLVQIGEGRTCDRLHPDLQEEAARCEAEWEQRYREYLDTHPHPGDSTP